MEPKVARHIILSQAGHTGLLTVRIADGAQQEERVAVLQAHQVDPITGAVLHVDLFEVSMDKSLRGEGAGHHYRRCPSRNQRGGKSASTSSRAAY